MNEAERLVELIPRLRRYARALVGDRASADDLVQDTLERAWAKLHLYRRGTDLRAWLFTVMHNVHVNNVRATRVTDTLEDELPELAQRASQGDALLVRDLDRAIARLPTEQRAVLLLVTLEEMSYEEVARAVGIPIGTVMSRLSRAREKLRMMMLGQGAAAKLKVVKRARNPLSWKPTCRPTPTGDSAPNARPRSKPGLPRAPRTRSASPPTAVSARRCALLTIRCSPSRFRNISKARRHVARVLAGSPPSPAGSRSARCSARSQAGRRATGAGRRGRLLPRAR